MELTLIAWDSMLSLLGSYSAISGECENSHSLHEWHKLKGLRTHKINEKFISFLSSNHLLFSQPYWPLICLSWSFFQKKFDTGIIKPKTELLTVAAWQCWLGVSGLTPLALTLKASCSFWWLWLELRMNTVSFVK